MNPVDIAWQKTCRTRVNIGHLVRSVADLHQSGFWYKVRSVLAVYHILSAIAGHLQMARILIAAGLNHQKLYLNMMQLAQYFFLLLEIQS